MARKNLLDGLQDLPEEQAPSAAYPMRGAGKSLVRSLDELARQADKFLEGETVLELDPALVDDSFVKDRLVQDNEDFRALVETIRTRGQDTPILVRPHAREHGRYQVVFGHRRLRAARELGRSVRAVVKPIDDRTHVIAQGQENSARANLTFIERAAFAKRLQDLGYDRQVISEALVTNAAGLSKMLSVTERIPSDIIDLIGDAPSVGRERWVEFSLLAGKSANEDKLKSLVAADGFAGMSSDEKFLFLYSGLKKSESPVRKHKKQAPVTKWEAKDQAVVADITQTGKVYSITLKAKHRAKFGSFLTRNLEAIYQQFLESEEDES
jgi:ParB family chromosome partitioning protein